MYYPLSPRRLLACPILLGLSVAAISARADSFTAFNAFDNIIEKSGPYYGDTRVTVENPNAGATYADFAVFDFTKADFGLNFPATGFSNLNLNLTDRSSVDAFAIGGQFDLYYTLDTATTIQRGAGSPLTYTGNASYVQGLTTDGTATGPSQFASAPVLLGTETYVKNTTANTVETFSLSGIPTNVVLDALNGTNGSTGLRLILAPHDSSIQASFYGYSTTDSKANNGAYRPNITFNADLNKPALGWKTGAGSWFPQATGTSNGDASWGGSHWVDGSVATFGGTPGVVNLTGAINASGLQFDSTGYTVAGGANHLTLTGGATVQVTNAGQTAEISAPISGTVGINKVGAGSLVLSSPLSDYTGTTTITGGAIVISADQNLGSPTAATTIALAGGTLRTSAPVELNVNRSLNGTGTLDAVGGAITVDGPVAAGAIAVVNGATTLGYNSVSFTSAAVGASSTLTVNGSIASSARTTLTGDGNVVLNGDNSGYGSGFSISKGTGAVGPTVTMSAFTSLGSGTTYLNAGALVSANDITVLNGISLGGNATIGGTTTGTTGAINFTNFALFGTTKKVLTINSTTTISSVITGDSGNANNSLNKAGPGRLILTAFGNGNVGTTVTGGTLEIGNGASLGKGDIAVTALAVNHVVLQIDNNTAIDDLSNIVLTSNGSFHGKLDLEFTGSPETIAALTIDGTSAAVGVHDASTDPDFIMGPGSVLVTAVVPEPATWTSLVLGSAALAGWAGRRRRG